MKSEKPLDKKEQQTKRINCLEDYISLIKKIKTQYEEANVYQDNIRIFYRGQASESFGLLPSVARDGFIKAEYYMIKEVILEKPDEFSELNYFDILAKLQHYGLPTRLLDVSENPLVALYFACDKENDCDGAVYYITKGFNYIEVSNNTMINFIAAIGMASGKWTGGFDIETVVENLHFLRPELANNLKQLLKHEEEKYGCNYIKKLYDRIGNTYRLVLPNKSDHRIIRQSGAFILFSNIIASEVENRKRFLNEIEDIKESVLREMEFKIIINKDSKKNIIDELDAIGVNKLYLFPDLENICNQVKDKWKNSRGNLIL